MLSSSALSEEDLKEKSMPTVLKSEGEGTLKYLGELEKNPDAQATPKTNSMRISANGSHPGSSIF